MSNNDKQKKSEEPKKRGRKKKERYDIPLDLVKLKEKFFDETIKKEQQFDSMFSNVSYNTAYKIYNKEGFTNNVLLFISNLLLKSPTLTDEIKNRYPVRSTVVKLTRELLFNEVELVNFSIYLDRFGWLHNTLSFYENLQVLGILVKVHLNNPETHNIIVSHFLEEDEKLSEKLNGWLKGHDYAHFIVNQQEFNKRYRELSFSGNNFCKNDYIDYNFMVDKILELSQAYFDVTKIGNELNEEEKKGGLISKPVKEESNKIDLSRLLHLSHHSLISDNLTIGMPQPNHMILEPKTMNEIFKTERYENENDLIKGQPSGLSFNNINMGKIGLSNIFNSKQLTNTMVNEPSESYTISPFDLFKTQSVNGYRAGNLTFNEGNFGSLNANNNSPANKFSLLPFSNSNSRSLGFNKNPSDFKTVPEGLAFNNIAQFMLEKNSSNKNPILGSLGVQSSNSNLGSSSGQLKGGSSGGHSGVLDGNKSSAFTRIVNCKKEEDESIYDRSSNEIETSTRLKRKRSKK